MNAPLSMGERASALAAHGMVRDALKLLERGALAGDPDACFTIGLWCLAGTHVHRDLTAARNWFGKAGQYGHPLGRTVHTAFLANGTGGARQWAQAIGQLRVDARQDSAAARQLALIGQMVLDADGGPAPISAPHAYSQNPEISLFKGFLSRAECDYLIDTADPLFRPADIVDPGSGRAMRNPIRTSDSAAFPLANENPAIHAINRRIAAASATDVEQGEPLQILRYAPGQQYRSHLDALPGTGNQRLFTFLIYLNTDYEGGQTNFVEAGLRIRGQRGDAILFRNALPDGTPDPMTRHAGLPVQRGTKYLASRWIRQRSLSLTR
ncbi:2OG-Fe(II) oxygenase [Sphingomonas sp. C3-2]|uniref:2OG-Fe(II) oxygenase n=1 Tax=Sphingomonas sp. C3-2 TaxID=3062169 RepID=UPI00294AF9E4|nr:2OG-Fe(II) oxygenase [Sphingomonas sp. C3-2]WOK37012.1 2OG-Fe(II) oxygenase [Sphingomonas sp. C3-2]